MQPARVTPVISSKRPSRYGFAARWLGIAALGLVTGLPCAVPAAAEVVYPAVEPGRTIEFPRDEGAHPEYRTEWWYVTGWLDDGGRAPLGFQVTFFRVRPGIAEQNPSRFAPKQVIFGHAAIAEPAHGRLRHAERSAREGFGLAYAREGGVDLRLDDWSMRREGEVYRADVRGESMRMQLELRPTQPPLLQGDGGYSRKGPDAGAASHYYSEPQLAVSGTVTIDGRERRVHGTAWFDHEWSSQYVDAGSAGWDWTGINLDGGGALMAFRMRDRQGGERWAAATLRSSDGSVRSFGPEAVEWMPGRRWRSARTGARYPVEWRLRVGDETFELAPLMDDAELDSRASTGTIYWEGPVTAKRAGHTAGRGYLELTGYAGSPPEMGSDPDSGKGDRLPR